MAGLPIHHRSSPPSSPLLHALAATQTAAQPAIARRADPAAATSIALTTVATTNASVRPRRRHCRRRPRRLRCAAASIPLRGVAACESGHARVSWQPTINRELSSSVVVAGASSILITLEATCTLLWQHKALATPLSLHNLAEIYSKISLGSHNLAEIYSKSRTISLSSHNLAFKSHLTVSLTVRLTWELTWANTNS